MAHAQLAEYLLILGERLVWPAGRSRDQDDPRLATAAHPGETLEDAVTAASILGSADDQQAARKSPVVHLQALVPDRGAAPDARSTRRYVASISGYSLPRTPVVGRLRRPPARAPALAAASGGADSSAEIRWASTIARVRSGRSGRPTRQPSLVLRTTASSGRGSGVTVVSLVSGVACAAALACWLFVLPINSDIAVQPALPAAA